MATHKPNITTRELPDARVEIHGTLSWEAFSTYEKKAFDRLAQHLELDGFRKGNVPEAIAKKHLGDELVLADMAELAIGELYPEILKDHKINAIGHPTLSLTKLARDNELGFTLTTSVLPQFALPDYKKIAKQTAPVQEATVSEEEVDKVLEDLRQIRAYGHVHDSTEHDHGHTEPLPEINDEFAKSFGNFATVAELREKIKENVLKEKTQGEKDKRRIAIMDSIIEKVDIAVPAILIDSEQEKMLAQVQAEVERSGMKFDEYLTHIKKTRDEVKVEYKTEAERRARFQLVLNAIAKDAQIVPSDEEIESEVQKLMQMYPGADKARTVAYADMMLTNDKVLSLLETL